MVENAVKASTQFKFSVSTYFGFTTMSIFLLSVKTFFVKNIIRLLISKNAFYRELATDGILFEEFCIKITRTIF